MSLLNTKQMAQFVAQGFLRFDELVPDELNRAAHEIMQKDGFERGSAGQPLFDLWKDDSVMGQIFRLPAVKGIIDSMVGPDPTYDHHAVHIVNKGTHTGQHWHADAIIDTRQHFDIQFMYFAHDTPREMGGTMILPGSQFRRISESDIARYQNFVGQQAMVGKAGTMMVLHHGMWHCAQPNFTDITRYMFKLRLNPTLKQQLLWDTSDLDDPQVPEIMGKTFGWEGNDDRLEFVNRIKFWRFLTGNEKFDMGFWMSRLENMPENILEAA